MFPDVGSKFHRAPPALFLMAAFQHSMMSSEPNASRRDSSGLPSVPRGKDGAGREKMEINFI